MTNKALRIMIADPQHFQRLRLERNFNREGYYGIAPVSNLEDMLVLLEYASTWRSGLASVDSSRFRVPLLVHHSPPPST